MTSLHFNWYGGTSVIGAITALGSRRALLMSTGVTSRPLYTSGLLADLIIRLQVSILVAITTLLRGPLMQRASFVQTDVLSTSGNIDMQMTYNVSADWAGVSNDRGHSSMVFQTGFSKVVREFQARSPIEVPGTKCDNCSLTLPVRLTCPYHVQLLSTPSPGIWF